MLELFSADTTIVLGLSLTDSEDKILHSAVSLAQRTGSRLIMVHAAQPYRTYSLAGEGIALPYEEYERQAFDQELESALNKIESIRDNLPSSLVCETKVRRDYPEDALEKVARQTRASLILCGFHKKTSNALFSGFSTALSLMAHATVPVMVIPSSTRLHFQDKPLTLLVADNLKDEGIQALRGAIGFSKSIDLEQLVHMHVNPSSYRDINQMVDQIKIAMLEGRIPNDPEFNAQDYIDRTKVELKTLLQRRLEAIDSSFTREFRYRPSVRFGNPVDEVHRLLVESKANVLVFGKHHILHRKQLSIGKIPYQAMVEQEVATIVVPDHAQSGAAGEED